MKGVSVLVGAVLIIAISLTAIAAVIQLGTPASQRLTEIAVLQEGKSTMNRIDTAVREVVLEGDGSTRVLNLMVTDGQYSVDTANDFIMFKMISNAQIVGAGESYTEGNLEIFGEVREAKIIIYYDIDLEYGAQFTKGPVKLVIQNDDGKVAIYSQ